MIVDDIVQAVDVETTTGQVGADEYVGRTAHEAEELPFAVALLHASMQLRDAEALAPEVLGHSFHTLAKADEYDARLSASQLAQQLSQCLQFILHGRIDAELLETFLGFVGIEVVQEVILGHELRHFLLVGGREQHAALHIGQHGKQLGHLAAEAHLQALVELVDDDGAEATALDVSLMQVVEQSAWCAHDELGLHLAQAAMFLHGRAASVEGYAANAGARLSAHLRRLFGQFATGDHDECLLLTPATQFFDKRQHISQGLARPCGTEQDQVFFFPKCLCSIELHGCQGDIHNISNCLNTFFSFSTDSST